MVSLFKYAAALALSAALALTVAYASDAFAQGHGKGPDRLQHMSNTEHLPARPQIEGTLPLDSHGRPMMHGGAQAPMPQDQGRMTHGGAQAPMHQNQGRMMPPRQPGDGPETLRHMNPSERDPARPQVEGTIQLDSRGNPVLPGDGPRR